MRRTLWIIPACLAILKTLSGTTLIEVETPPLGTQQAVPLNSAAAGNSTFFIANQGVVGSGGTSSTIGWFYNPATSTVIDVQDPSLGTQQAVPNNVVAAGNNTFFIANSEVVTNSGPSNIIGWFYDPGTSLSTATQVQDPSLGTQEATPDNVAVAGNNTFFIANSEAIGNGGTSSIVGWFYDPGTSLSTATQVQDTSLGTQLGAPFNVTAAGNNTFFISNSEVISSGGSSNIVGWFYDPGTSLSTATQVQDLSLGTQLGLPFNIATENNTFFIINDFAIGAGGFGSIVGWFYDPGTSLSTATQVQDLSLGTQDARPIGLAGAGNNTYFIVNDVQITAGGDNIVGWFYDPGTSLSTPTQVKDLAPGTQMALPTRVVAAGNNNFFIVNGDQIGAGGTGSIVGWRYTPTTSTLTEVQDPSLGTQQATPFNVVAAGNNTLFISNASLIGAGGFGSIVGWFYDLHTLTQVQDPSLGTQAAQPFNVVAAGNNTFFIQNERSIGAGGSSSIVGWFYDPSTSTLIEVQDPSLGTQPGAPFTLVTANNNFFIGNSELLGAGSSTNIVGWYFIPFFSPNVLPPSSIQGFSRRNKFLTQTDHFNLIEWTAPAGSTPSGYMIFRDAALTDRIATLPNNVFEFLDHNRMPKHLYSYFVVAVVNGSLSSPLEVQVYVP